MTHEFTKTTWVDGTTAITSAQLNRIEEGVEQAHLSTIDAVTGTTSGNDYPVGITMFRVNDEAGWPFTNMLIVNMKVDEFRFTQWAYRHGASTGDVSGALFRHWHSSADAWTPFRRADEPFEASSNSNGFYRKWDNGTLECWKFPHQLTYSTDARLRASWTYPHQFAGDAPGVTATGCGTTTTATPLATEFSMVYTGVPGLSNVDVDMTRISGGTNFESTDTFNVALYARGRWE